MKINTTLLVLGVIALLVLGSIIGGLAFPKTVEVEKEKVITKEVQVIQEVEKEVPLDVKATYLDPAVAEFLKEDLEECKGEEYDEDQISVKSVEDWSVTFDDKDYTVDFEVKLKYLDKDVEEKCYETYEVSVFYEEDEKPEVSY